MQSCAEADGTPASFEAANEEFEEKLLMVAVVRLGVDFQLLTWVETFSLLPRRQSHL
jgi:hypothetical protein